MDDRREAQERVRRSEKLAAGPDVAVDARIDACRKDRDFQARLTKLIEDNQRVLDRLAN